MGRRKHGDPPYIVFGGTAPSTATVGTGEAEILTATTGRKYLAITNTHATARVSLSFGTQTAVADRGITIMPNGSLIMNRDDITDEAVRAVSSAASTVVSIQEGL